jgi:uncharacterized protein YjbJ (UPF0337 family)
MKVITAPINPAPPSPSASASLDGSVVSVCPATRILSRSHGNWRRAAAFTWELAPRCLNLSALGACAWQHRHCAVGHKAVVRPTAQHCQQRRAECRHLPAGQGNAVGDAAEQVGKTADKAADEAKTAANKTSNTAEDAAKDVKDTVKDAVK